MTSQLLAAALDLPQAYTQIQTVLPTLRQVTKATLVRYKPGRRALIEYHLDTATGPLVLLGKLRVKGLDLASYQLQQALWHQGFAADSPDGYSVPEPLGVIPHWHMWLQRKVPGVPATQLLPTPAGVPLACRIAALADKLHQIPISTAKTHTLADELRILHERLPLVAQQHPQWQARLTHILKTCDLLTQSRPAGLLAAPLPPTLIHRDFYADQVLVEGDRLWLVDLDLCCQGDPALDIGNFIAHITEQSLRQLADPAAMVAQEAALRDAFIETRAGEQADRLRWTIELYTVLTLVRHIHISTRIAARRPYTEALLTLCETRLQSQSPEPLRLR